VQAVTIDFNIYPEKPKFFTFGDARGMGAGKTTDVIDILVSEVTKNPDFRAVLAVPRHQLGEDIAKRLIDRGLLDARVFYGRDAIDPEMMTGQSMCRELDRTEEINKALGDVARQACKNGSAECQFFRTCSYQAQQRLTPRVWIVAHNLMFRERPPFIPKPDFVGIDEAFWNASLNGIEKTRLVTVTDLAEHRLIKPLSKKKSLDRVDYGATEDLKAVSDKMARVLHEEMSGRVRKAVLDSFDDEELRAAYRLEWRRKIELDIKPNMPLEMVAAMCRKVSEHNQQVKLLSEFWDLMLQTKTGGFNRSPFLDLQKAIRLDKGRKGGNQPLEEGVYLAWSDDIHPSWHVNTIITDATMSEKIVRRFYPNISTNHFFNNEPSPHTHIRQITDRRISKDSFVPNEHATPRKQTTQRNNLERVRRILEVQACEVWPRRLLVICQKDLEIALINTGRVPQNVELEHFKNHSGQNQWRDVSGLITVGRTEPGVREVERQARALFGVDIGEIEPDMNGTVQWPLAAGHIRLRDGTSVAVQSSRHPDPHVHEMWEQICVAELMQALGRGRGNERTEANPLEIIVLTNVPLPITADEAVTWDEIQPSLARVMWSRGAVPAIPRDMAAAYPDLFKDPKAAEYAVQREAEEWLRAEGDGRNYPKTPIKIYYLISVLGWFSSVSYRRPGSRGPAGRLLYDPERVNPETWLAERLGARVVP
jgi:putative DNA primase/helicase